MNKNFQIMTISIILFLFSMGCTQLILGDSEQYEDPAYVTFKVVNEEGATIFYNENDFEVGTNALDAMKDVFGSRLKYDEYPFGVFITEINNIAPSEGYFWELFVDGSTSPLGIDSYKIEKDIIFEWRLSEINFD